MEILSHLTRCNRYSVAATELCVESQTLLSSAHRQNEKQQAQTETHEIPFEHKKTLFSL